jgi:hypothetical protein
VRGGAAEETALTAGRGWLEAWGGGTTEKAVRLDLKQRGGGGGAAGRWRRRHGWGRGGRLERRLAARRRRRRATPRRKARPHVA